MASNSSVRLGKIVSHLCEQKCDSTLSTNDSSARIFNYKPFPPLSVQYPASAKKLHSIFGNRYSEDAKVLRRFGKDATLDSDDGNTRIYLPQAVVFPKSSAEISSVMKICSANKIPIIAFGGGTSLESQIMAYNGGITVSFSEMQNVIRVYKEDLQVRVQPGISFSQLNRYLQPYGLFLGSDPAPVACIGGMIGTCCSGPSSIKYGTMRNQVISMTVVLPSGVVLNTGQRAMKSVAGYDLNSLFCGSEGTLGIISEVTLRVRPIPKFVEIAQALFDSIDQVGKVAEDVLQSGISLAAFEFMDNVALEAATSYDRSVKYEYPPNKHMILFKFVAPSRAHIESDIRLLSKIVAKTTNYPFVFSTDAPSRERLWRIRKSLFYRAKLAKPSNNAMVVTDVAVPLSLFGECLSMCKDELDKSILTAPMVGHIGDGNFHAFLSYNSNDSREVKEMHRLNDFIVKTALEMEGTSTAEHGIGFVGDRTYLTDELGSDTVDFMRNLKSFIDPNIILNPGKVVNICPLGASERS